MKKHKPSPAGRSTGWATAAILLALSGLLAFWLWPHSHVRLDQDGYEITIALYRACNQQSESGLDAVQAVLGGLEVTDETTMPQRSRLESIIDDARGGHWAVATKACRRLLEDQVDR